jgi:hypothetical protein
LEVAVLVALLIELVVQMEATLYFHQLLLLVAVEAALKLLKRD